MNGLVAAAAEAEVLPTEPVLFCMGNLHRRSSRSRFVVRLREASKSRQKSVVVGRFR